MRLIRDYILQSLDIGPQSRQLRFLFGGRLLSLGSWWPEYPDA